MKEGVVNTTFYNKFPFCKSTFRKRGEWTVIISFYLIGPDPGCPPCHLYQQSVPLLILSHCQHECNPHHLLQYYLRPESNVFVSSTIYDKKSNIIYYCIICKSADSSYYNVHCTMSITVMQCSRSNQILIEPHPGPTIRSLDETIWNQSSI